MKFKSYLFYAFLSTMICACGNDGISDSGDKNPPTDTDGDGNTDDNQDNDNDFPTSRDPLLWPFSSTSIWNMPIGSNAEYVHAGLEQTNSMTVDEDYIVMTPNEPLLPIYYSSAGWDRSKSRCDYEGNRKLFEAPIPKSWEVSPATWDGLTPNAGLAVLMPDGRTIKQAQPFAHCGTADEPGTAMFTFADEDLYGDGIYGAHGGSGLSAVGGALRCHELTPTSGPIRHALKINLYGAKNLYFDNQTGGFRWPATKADSYAGDPNSGYGSKRTTSPVKECRMGALLAIPAAMKIEDLGLKTEPAKILAQAFQDYGAYVVDDTAWDVNAIVVEWGPAGRFTEEFEKNWGFKFNTDGSDEWGQDLIKIYSNLHVVVNNTETSKGGGGTPRQPLAPMLE